MTFLPYLGYIAFFIGVFLLSMSLVELAMSCRRRREYTRLMRKYHD